MEGIILAVLIQYVVEYRFAGAFFRVLVDGYKQISSRSILCRSCQYMRIGPENTKC